MKSVTPVWPGETNTEEIIIGGKGYFDLHTIITTDNHIVSRWKLNWKERITVFFKGNIYLWVQQKSSVFNPVCLHVESLKHD